MRHRKLSRKLSRPMGHRRATLRNLAIALLKYQRIKTTCAKAKSVQPLVERLIRLGKQQGLNARRQAFKILGDKNAIKALFSQIAPLFKNRSSGFTRIINTSYRRGDAARMVFWELTQKPAKKVPQGLKKEKAVEENPPSKEIQTEKTKKAKPEIKPTKAKLPKEKLKPAKKQKPKKFLGGLRRLFKKERDSL